MVPPRTDAIGNPLENPRAQMRRLQAAWRAAKLSSADVCALLAVWSYADLAGRSFATLATLADSAGLTRSAIQRSLTRARVAGVLEVERRGRRTYRTLVDNSVDCAHCARNTNVCSRAPCAQIARTVRAPSEVTSEEEYKTDPINRNLWIVSEFDD